MNIRNKENRLDRFYGDVAKAQNRDIINLVTGKKILDVGCGYGTLLNQIRCEKAEMTALGIDIDQEAIDVAKRLYGIDVKRESVYEMDCPDDYFDTVILRESIHHLKEAGALGKALEQIKRVCAKELIIFDPNPNWIIRFSRRLIRHADPEASIDDVVNTLIASGFNVKDCGWRDVIAFPLSGGLVGLELVPNVNFVKRVIIGLDSLLNAASKKLGIQRHLCWRYIIYATKERG